MLSFFFEHYAVVKYSYIAITKSAYNWNQTVISVSVQHFNTIYGNPKMFYGRFWATPSLHCHLHPTFILDFGHIPLCPPSNMQMKRRPLQVYAHHILSRFKYVSSSVWKFHHSGLYWKCAEMVKISRPQRIVNYFTCLSLVTIYPSQCQYPLPLPTTLIFLMFHFIATVKIPATATRYTVRRGGGA